MHNGRVLSLSGVINCPGGDKTKTYNLTLYSTLIREVVESQNKTETKRYVSK
jgi:hypothetical protein